MNVNEKNFMSLLHLVSSTGQVFFFFSFLQMKANDVKKRRALVKKLVRKVIKAPGGRRPEYPSAASLQAAIMKEFPVSQSTILRDLRFLGFRALVRRRIPILDPSVHRKRLAFAKKRLRSWKPNDTKGIVFSDEHWVSTNDHSSRLQWVTDRKDLLPRVRRNVKSVPHVMVWAAVGYGYKSPIVVYPLGETVNHTTYKEKCLAVLLPQIKGRIFQQDGARPHWQHTVLPYIKQHEVDVIQDWPANSPDLNVIEELWPELNRRVANLAPTTNAGLVSAIHQAWQSIPMSVINAHINSFQNKLQKCVRNGGRCL